MDLRSGGRLGDERVLCNVAVANLALAEVIPAAAAAGFTHVSIMARSHRRAVERQGSSNAQLRHLLDDHGLAVSEVEAAADWLGGPRAGEHAVLDTVYDTAQLLAAGEALGAATLVALHFGPPVPPDDAAAAFAELCRRAAEHGLRVALEYAAVGTIAEVASAWEIVRLAGAPNGGLLVDLWHHRRGGSADATLLAVPADRIFGVQLSDGAAQPEGTLLDDLLVRRLPGDGDFEAAAFVALLDRHGVRCPVGVEALRREVVEQGPLGAAHAIADALGRTLRRSRATDAGVQQ